MSAPTAGWYADPAGSGGSRWWDGTTWTEHVQPAAPGTPPAAPAAWAPQPGSAAPSFVRRNRYSLSAIGFVVLYAVLLVSVHVVVFGILPAVLVVRAWRSREQLAVPATVLAVATLALAVYNTTG